VIDLWNEPGAVLTQYTWGLDLSGTLQGAGGIRGLVAAHIPAQGMGGMSGMSCPNGGTIWEKNTYPDGKTPYLTTITKWE
jgi:hypothetical protein